MAFFCRLNCCGNECPVTSLIMAFSCYSSSVILFFHYFVYILRSCFSFSVFNHMRIITSSAMSISLLSFLQVKLCRFVLCWLPMFSAMKAPVEQCSNNYLIFIRFPFLLTIRRSIFVIVILWHSFYFLSITEAYSRRAALPLDALVWFLRKSIWVTSVLMLA